MVVSIHLKKNISQIGPFPQVFKVTKHENICEISKKPLGSNPFQQGLNSSGNILGRIRMRFQKMSASNLASFWGIYV